MNGIDLMHRPSGALSRQVARCSTGSIELDTVGSSVFHQVGLTVLFTFFSCVRQAGNPLCFDSELPCSPYWLKLALEYYPRCLNTIYLPLQPFGTLISSRFSCVAPDSLTGACCARSWEFPLRWLQFR